MFKDFDSAEEFFGVGINQGIDREADGCATCDGDLGEGVAVSPPIPYNDLPDPLQEMVRERWKAEHPDQPFDPDSVAVQVGGDIGGLRDLLEELAQEDSDDMGSIIRDLLRVTSEYKRLMEPLAELRHRRAIVERRIERRTRVLHGELAAGEGLGNNDTERGVRMGHAEEQDEELTALLDERAELRAAIDRQETLSEMNSKRIHVALTMFNGVLRDLEHRLRENELEVRKSEVVHAILEVAQDLDPHELVARMERLKEVGELLQ